MKNIAGQLHCVRKDLNGPADEKLESVFHLRARPDGRVILPDYNDSCPEQAEPVFCQKMLGQAKNSKMRESYRSL